MWKKLDGFPFVQTLSNWNLNVLAWDDPDKSKQQEVFAEKEPRNFVELFQLNSQNVHLYYFSGYFSEGREYVYEYEGQVLSGLPGVSKEVAGIKIVADTRIQMKENGKCLLRVS